MTIPHKPLTLTLPYRTRIDILYLADSWEEVMRDLIVEGPRQEGHELAVVGVVHARFHLCVRVTSRHVMFCQIMRGQGVSAFETAVSRATEQ